MCFGGGGSTNTTTTTIPDWLKPYATQYLDTAQTVTNRPYTPYTGQQVANLAPGSQAAISGINNVASGTPGLNAADQMLGETLNGQGMNPYVQQAAQPAINDATMAYNNATSANLARFQGANRNSTAYEQAQGLNQQDLARGLGNATAPLYSQEYDQERNRQMQAAGLEPTINSTLENNYQGQLAANQQVTGQNQGILSNLLQQFQTGINWPQTQLSNYGSAIGAITGAGQNSQTTGPGASPVGQALGGGLGAYLLYSLMAA